MWHPFLISITVIDLLILVLLLKACAVAVEVILNWNQKNSSSAQLLLERKAETADIMMQWAFLLMAVNSLLLVVAVTRILPRLVPGAMCGMGVMQALNGREFQMIFLRSLAFAMLYWQQALARLNHTCPISPLTITLARMNLLVLLLFGMATYDSAMGFFVDLNPSRPVSCCAVVLDQLTISSAQHPTASLFSSPFWPATFGLFTTVILVFSGVSFLFRKVMFGTIFSIILGASGLIWTVTAGVSLIFFWSHYIYQVLDHHCPFCFFLPEHYGIGFPLLLLLALASLESPLPLLWLRIQTHHPEFNSTIQIRCRRSIRSLFFSVSGFCLLAVLPAVIWRARFGVWI